MEEIKETTSRSGSLLCIASNSTVGMVAGATGLLYSQTYQEWKWIPGNLLARHLCVGLVLGAAVSVAALRLRPTTEEWVGWRATAVMIFGSMIVSAGLSGVVAYLAGDWSAIGFYR